MSKPTEIAEAKLSLATTSATSTLKGSAEAIHRRATRGMGGGTIAEVKNECIATLRGLEGIATQELSWVLDQTFLANPATVDRCNTIARQAVDALLEDCVSVLRGTVVLCGGNQRQLGTTEADLHTQRDKSLMSISLALDSRYSELRLRRLRAVLASIQRLAQSLLRLGT